VSTYLSTTRVFLAPTPEIRALHDKSILIVTPSGDHMWAKICVEDADPEGCDAGKCSVLVWTASTDERNFVLFDRVHLPIIGRRAGRGRGGLLSVRESVHEIADCPELCYTISGFNMPINPLESFLPISYALLAGRL
jgi:hypothetical protein